MQGGKELPKIQGGAAAGASGPSVTAVTPETLSSALSRGVAQLDTLLALTKMCL